MKYAYLCTYIVQVTKSSDLHYCFLGKGFEYTYMYTPEQQHLYILVERAEKYLDDVPTANSICIQHFHLCIESNKPIYIAVSKDKTPWN